MPKVRSVSFEKARTGMRMAEPTGLERLLHYTDLIRRWWKAITAVTILAAVITYVITKFWLYPWYQAEAILRPASQETEGSLSLGGLLSSLSGVSSIGGSSLTSLFGGTSPDAAEQVAMLQSYDLTMAVVDKFDLTYVVRRRTWYRELAQRLGFEPYRRYRVYQAMQDLFEADYDDKEGNLTVDFLAPSSELATKVLAGYIDVLRGRLRKRAIETAQRAVVALNQEVAQSQDAVLVNQLDQLIAQQIQQEKTAEVQADFAFVTIEHPVADRKPYTPVPLLDSAVVGAATPFLFFLWLVFRERLDDARSSIQIRAEAALAPAYTEPEPERQPEAARVAPMRDAAT